MKPNTQDRTAAVARGYARADALMADLQRAADLQGMHLACQRGCAACCTYPVATTTAEGAVIAAAVEAMPKGARMVVLAKLAAWNRAWALHSKGRIGVGAVALTWQVKRLPCPFLDLLTHDCQVYAARPVACRVHHAVNLDPLLQQLATHVVERCACPIEAAPEGCFTTPLMAQHGHPSSIVQADVNLQERAGAMLASELEAAGDDTLDMGMLPEVVWLAGSKAYGWQVPRTLSILPAMKRAFPKKGA